jgi:hypothetical protein
MCFQGLSSNSLVFVKTAEKFYIYANSIELNDTWHKFEILSEWIPRHQGSGSYNMSVLFLPNASFITSRSSPIIGIVTGGIVKALHATATTY